MKGTDEYNQQMVRQIRELIHKNHELALVYAYMTDLTSRTAYTYLNQIKNFREYTAHKSPRQLTIDDFTTYLLKYKYDEDGKEFTASYRIVQYHALKRYADFLEAQEWQKINLMSKVKRPAFKESQETIAKREVGYLTEEEIKIYLSNIRTYQTEDHLMTKYNDRARDMAIVLLFLTTGIRATALRNLDVDNLDLENRTIRVTDKGEEVHTYILQKKTLNALDEWLVERQHWLDMLNPKKETNALFFTQRGKRFTHEGLRQLTLTYSKNIGKHITPHKLRATYGTQLYNQTQNIYFVQQCMHHSSPVTTERYIRGQKNFTQEASSILENLF